MFKPLGAALALLGCCIGNPAAVSTASYGSSELTAATYPTKRVLASWYGSHYHGRTTASGEAFNMFDHTAASKTLPFNSQLRVCYQSCTTVRINDRGPYSGERGLDLSFAAAKEIGLIEAGVAPITMRRLS